MYLSKSDFKIARTCGTKLYYRKLRYPTTQDDDPYLNFLAAHEGELAVHPLERRAGRGAAEESGRSASRAPEASRSPG